MYVHIDVHIVSNSTVLGWIRMIWLMKLCTGTLCAKFPQIRFIIEGIFRENFNQETDPTDPQSNSHPLRERLRCYLRATVMVYKGQIISYLHYTVSMKY